LIFKVLCSIYLHNREKILITGKREDSGYVGYEKRFLGRKSATYYRITATGQSALLAYSRYLAELISTLPKGGTP